MTDRDRINQAVDRLAGALHELSYRGRLGINPEIRTLVCPGDPKPEDVNHLHGIGLTADLAEILAETIEQLITRIDTAAVPINPTAAAEFARSNPELAKDVSSAFHALDVDALARTVLNDAAPSDRASVTRAIKAMFRPTQDQQEDGDDS